MEKAVKGIRDIPRMELGRYSPHALQIPKMNEISEKKEFGMNFSKKTKSRERMDFLGECLNDRQNCTAL
jgi:hypothetical protein